MADAAGMADKCCEGVGAFFSILQRVVLSIPMLLVNGTALPSLL
jgi:hypothetical protein